MHTRTTCASLYVINKWLLFLSRTGRPLSDQEITGMLIGLLMAGQHTSSSTSSWLGFFLARDKHYQVSNYCVICNTFPNIRPEHTKNNLKCVEETVHH